MSKTYTDQLAEAVKTFDEIKDTLDKLKNRLSDVSDTADKAEKRGNDIETALKEIQSAVMLHEVGLRKLFLGYTSQSVLSDAIVRYLAGYEPGDYKKEAEMAAERGEAFGITDLEIKNKDFDVKRLAAIAQEIANVQAEDTEKQRKIRQMAESTIVAPDGKPVLRVVR